MIFDAHIHVGNFPRLDGKGGDAYYWSPARLLQYMGWAGVGEFIFSSTNACWDAHAETMHSEAKELLRMAEQKNTHAHPFFWVSRKYLNWDRYLERIPDFYEGFKLHGGEAHWTEHGKDLKRVLAIAKERQFPVQIHTGKDEANSCKAYLPYCKAFPEIRFDLAHGYPAEEAIQILNACSNVWIDTSFMELDDVRRLWEIAPMRVMYGSDFPAPMLYMCKSCTQYMRRQEKAMDKIGGGKMMFKNARDFMHGGTSENT